MTAMPDVILRFQKRIIKRMNVLWSVANYFLKNKKRQMLKIESKLTWLTSLCLSSFQFQIHKKIKGGSSLINTHLNFYSMQLFLLKNTKEDILKN